jgi:hypothetical protein
MFLVLAVAAPAGAAIAPLGSVTFSGSAPRLVVDATGTGYTSWADGGPGAALEFCRLPQGAAACASRQSFAYPTGDQLSTDNGNTPVFTARGQLALLDSRCCLTSTQKFLLLSSNGGTTFTPPAEILSDHASGASGNLLDLGPGALFAGSPEQLLSSSTGPVAGGGSIQATRSAARRRRAPPMPRIARPSPCGLPPGLDRASPSTLVRRSRAITVGRRRSRSPLRSRSAPEQPSLVGFGLLVEQPHGPGQHHRVDPVRLRAVNRLRADAPVSVALFVQSVELGDCGVVLGRGIRAIA